MEKSAEISSNKYHFIKVKKKNSLKNDLYKFKKQLVIKTSTMDFNISVRCFAAFNYLCLEKHCSLVFTNELL